MISQPPSHGQIDVEPQSQAPNQMDESELQQSPQTQHATTLSPRAAPSRSLSLNMSNVLSGGAIESPIMPTRPPDVVSFPNLRDTTTVGQPEFGVQFSSYNPTNSRMSTLSALHPPNGEHANGRRRANDIRRSAQPTLVPSEDWVYPPVQERLEKTLKSAEAARHKSRLTARTARWSMAFVAGAQVLLGALITGLSALRLDGQKSASTTTALGILSTLFGSYMAHVRATAEPERSMIRIHRLDGFIRDLDAFILDHGCDTTNKYKPEIDKYRHELELILTEASPLNMSRRLNSLSAEDKVKSKGIDV